MTLLSNASDEPNDNPTVSFSVLDSFGNFGKPNAIVRPVRRMESTEEPTVIGNTEMTGASMLIDTTQAATAVNNELENFTKQLDVKLKHLQASDKKSSSKNVIIFVIFFLCTKFSACIYAS